MLPDAETVTINSFCIRFECTCRIYFDRCLYVVKRMSFKRSFQFQGYVGTVWRLAKFCKVVLYQNLVYILTLGCQFVTDRYCGINISYFWKRYVVGYKTKNNEISTKKVDSDILLGIEGVEEKVYRIHS